MVHVSIPMCLEEMVEVFKERIRKEATPERVFELCKIVASEKEIESSKLKEIIEPKEFATETTYYGTIKNAAIELGLIEEREYLLSFIQNKKVIKNIDEFRLYCNSVLFEDSSTEFYRLCRGFLDAGGEWLRHISITTDENARRVSEFSDYPVLDLQKTLIPAVRFWISFLGFGYISEIPKVKMVFIPNAYIAVKDFVILAKLEKGREYSITEFLDALPNGISVATSNARKDKAFNLAMSNALRQLHDMKEIQLKRHMDSAERWTLYENKSHEFQSEITHLVFKGVK